MDINIENIASEEEEDIQPETPLDIEVAIKKAMGSLNDKEKMIIKERYGLVDGKPKTLEAIGKILGITRERVRQIEARALKKLRDSMK